MQALDRTTDPAKLREAFTRDGFVHIRGFLDSETLSTVREKMARVVRDVVPTLSTERVYYEDLNQRESLKQIQQLHTCDPYFHDMFIDGPAQKLAEALLDDSVVPRNMQYFNKPPRIGQATPPHQDGFYFMLDPCEALTMWLALEDVDEANGCVRYVPGSHLLGMRQHNRTQTLGFSQGIVDYPTAADSAAEVAMTARAGDLLAHHALTIHRAEGNQSENRSRKALGFIYYATAAREDAARHEAYQRQLAQELAASKKIAECKTT